MRTYAILWLFLVCLSAWCLFARADAQVAGVITDENGVGIRAVVGLQGDRERFATDSQGRVRVTANTHGKHLVAHASGYRLASMSAAFAPFAIRLERLPREDHRDYQWIDPHFDPQQANKCANCHGEIYREWQSSGHARSATNAKFLHLFAGTDGKAPMHTIWNARAEHPDGAAVCATCHVPTLQSATLEYDVREAKGDAKSGIHCDYCHKVTGVTEKLGARFGRDALELLRPAPNDVIAYGPLDDAVRRGESFAYFPVYKDSRYCAACHEGTVFGVHAYATYSEWLASSAKQRGQQCQDCHMTPTGTMTNIAPGKGGIERRASTLASHHTVGGDGRKLKQSLSLHAVANSDGTSLRVDVEIVSNGVGHRMPTGFVDRHLILVVQAFDNKNRPVELLKGTKLPPSAGKWSDSAGSLFAKQLTGEANRTPSPFWLPVFNVIDTRLRPDEPERHSFVFGNDARRATVQLWYRRFWQEVADARAWTDNDLLIHEVQLVRDAAFPIP